MLIRRCAWHRSYRGYPFVFGVASWRGLRFSFTDGMCVRCASRLRHEWNLPPRAATALAPGLGRLRAAAVAVVMLTALILAARPLEDLRSPWLISEPPETVLVPMPVDVDAMPALAVAQAPHRVRAKVTRVAFIPSPPPTKVALVAPEPAVIQPVATRRSELPFTFAALPHAGLTQQTP